MVTRIQENKNAVPVEISVPRQQDELASVRRFHQDVLPGYKRSKLIKLGLEPPVLGKASTRFKGSVYLKDESDRYGLPAFKVLGAAYASFVALCEAWHLDRRETTIDTLRDHARAVTSKPVLVAATDGNHGRAVAFFSNLVGIDARIYIPSGVSKVAEQAIDSEGDNVVVLRLQEDYDECVKQAAAFSKEESSGGQQRLLIQDTAWDGYTYIPQLIVDGYQTIFAEVSEELASHHGTLATHVFCPVGVGSLAQAAVEYYTSTRDPQAALPTSMAANIIAVEPTEAACLATSLANATRTSIRTGHTTMAGLNCGTPSSASWPYLRAGVRVVVTIEDEQAMDSSYWLAKSNIEAGPCGAAPVAALHNLLNNTVEAERLGLLDDERVVVILLMTEGKKATS